MPIGATLKILRCCRHTAKDQVWPLSTWHVRQPLVGHANLSIRNPVTRLGFELVFQIVFRESNSAELTRMNRSKTSLQIGIAVLFVLLLGCRTPQPSEQLSDTAVLISRRTPEEISAVTTETFKRHHFEIASTRDEALVFDRRGTFSNDMMSSNWADGPTWLRVKVFRTHVDHERVKLGCEIFLVQDPEDPMFGHEKPYGGHKKEIKQIMQEIGLSLNH